MGFPDDSVGEESFCQCRRCKRRGFDSWVRKIPWRRKWQPTPVFLPGEAHGQRSLVGYSPWGRKESDTTKRLSRGRGTTNIPEPFLVSHSVVTVLVCVPARPLLGCESLWVYTVWCIYLCPPCTSPVLTQGAAEQVHCIRFNMCLAGNGLPFYSHRKQVIAFLSSFLEALPTTQLQWTYWFPDGRRRPTDPASRPELLGHPARCVPASCLLVAGRQGQVQSGPCLQEVEPDDVFG